MKPASNLTALIAQWREPPVAPEPPTLGMKHMTEMSIRKARRDWWREGYAQACRDRADELAAVVQAEASAPPVIQGWPSQIAEAVNAIYTAVRGDEKSEFWTIRRFLDERDVFNDDIQGSERLIEEVCKWLMKPSAIHGDPPSVSAVPTGEQ